MLRVRGTEEAITVSGAGVELRAYDYGNAGAVPMVLVHGIQDLAQSLEPIAEHFRHRFHVVAYDLRGHGDSGKPGVYSLPHLVADLHALLAQHGLERPVLVGHSLGGQVTSHYAAIFPEVARKLISIEGLGPPVRLAEIPRERRQQRARDSIAALLRGPEGRRPMADVDDAVALFRRFHPRLDIDRAQRLVELGTEPDPRGGVRWKWDPLVMTTWLSHSPLVSEEMWGWIECPVLLVTGGLAHEFWSRSRGFESEVAQLDPTELERRVALFQDAVHRSIDGAGHMVHYDCPQQLVTLMEGFLGD